MSMLLILQIRIATVFLLEPDIPVLLDKLARKDMLELVLDQHLKAPLLVSSSLLT